MGHVHSMLDRSRIRQACLQAPLFCADLRCPAVHLSCRLYQSALALRPKDADVALAAAQALIAAHNYNRAIDYYNRWDGLQSLQMTAAQLAAALCVYTPCVACCMQHLRHADLASQLPISACVNRNTELPCLRHCRAIRNDPNKVVLQHGLARLLLRLGQTRQATALLDKCLAEHKAGGTGSLETLALDVDT